MNINTIYNESNLHTMANMLDGFIDLTVTSPPYGNLRTYKGYTFPFEDIAKELYRVTKDGGTLVWVVGDESVDGSESGDSFRQALYFKDIGFNLHDTMVYEKDSSPFPSSAKSTRYSQIFEYMFILTKGKPKTVNLIKDRRNINFQKGRGVVTVGGRNKDGTLMKAKIKPLSEWSYRTNIWRIPCGFGKSAKQKIAYTHPAIFPEELARDHILTWSNEGDLVYDCFSGSGTTPLMAKSLNRNYIGSEMSVDYSKIIDTRLRNYVTEIIKMSDGLSLV